MSFLSVSHTLKNRIGPGVTRLSEVVAGYIQDEGTRRCIGCSGRRVSPVRGFSVRRGFISLYWALILLPSAACTSHYELAPVVTDDERNLQYRLATVHPGSNYVQSAVNSEQNPTGKNIILDKSIVGASKDPLQSSLIPDSGAFDERNSGVEMGQSPIATVQPSVRDPVKLAENGIIRRSETAEPEHFIYKADGEGKKLKASPSAVSGKTVTTKKSGSPARAAAKKKKKPNFSNNNKNMLMLNFEWPLKGKIRKHFSQTDRKGIEIIGRQGQNIRASEAGKVVYSGQGLIGFGKVLVIKHNENYLSAYANNGDLFVKEGQRVKKGQSIAKLGAPSSRKSFLHFEIRKNGKPVNPLSLLP